MKDDSYVHYLKCKKIVEKEKVSNIQNERVLLMNFLGAFVKNTRSDVM